MNSYRAIKKPLIQINRALLAVNGLKVSGACKDLIAIWKTVGLDYSWEVKKIYKKKRKKVTFPNITAPITTVISINNNMLLSRTVIMEYSQEKFLLESIRMLKFLLVENIIPVFRIVVVCLILNKKSIIWIIIVVFLQVNLPKV